MSNVRGNGGKVEDFPVDVFPPVVADYITQAADALEVDAEAVGGPLLVALSTAIGSTHRVQFSPDWTEVGIVWLGVIGLSGSGKSPAMKYGLRHLEAYQSGKLAEAEQGGPDVKPERVITRDATLEALRGLLLVNHRGVMFHADELGSWLGGMGEYKRASSGDAARWLTSWDGGAWFIDRKGDGAVIIRNPHVPVTGGIQPGLLQGALFDKTRRASGMLARMLLIWPRDTVLRITRRSVKPAADAGMAEVTRRLFGLNFEGEGTADRRPVDVGVNEDAQGMLVRWWDAVADRITAGDYSNDERAMLSKLKGYALRFALVLHLTRCAAGDGVGHSWQNIDAETMRRALRLADWFKATAIGIYRKLEKSEADEVDEAIMGYIRERGRATVRELNRSIAVLRGPAERVEVACKRLVNSDKLRTQEYYPDGGGRMVTYYFPTDECGEGKNIYRSSIVTPSSGGAKLADYEPADSGIGGGL
jgi:hypothetical protein